ncbi:MAG: glycosyltransferase family 39 protein [Bdellovibrionota bacterium]
MSDKNNRSSAFAAALAALVAAAGITALLLAFVPFEWAKERADHYAADGRADFFTEPAFEAIGLRLRIAAAALLCLGGLSWWKRKSIAGFLDELSESAGSLLQDLKSQIREGLRTSGKAHLWTLGGILLAGTALRVYFLFQPFRCDEAFSFTNYVSKPLYIALSNYSEPNNHLFHTFLSRLSFLLFGGEPWALRLPALLAGILLIPTAYLALRLMCGKEAALLGTALTASSVELIKYSTNARGYSLVGLFFLLLLCLSIYLRESHRSLAGWSLFSLFSALGLYTVPTMLLPLGGLGLWLLLEGAFFESQDKKKEFIGHLVLFSLAAAALTLLLYAPAFVAVSGGKVAANPWVSSAGWEKFSEGFPRYAWVTWMQWNRDLPSLLAWLISLGVLLDLALYRQSGTQKVPIAIPLLVWGSLFAVGRTIVPPARSWLYLAPLYYGLGAAGILLFIYRIFKRSESTAANTAIALALLLALGLGGKTALTGTVYRSDETGEAIDGKSIAQYLAPKIQEGDAVVGGGLTPPTLRYYFGKEKLLADPFNGELHSRRRLFVVVPKGANPRKTLSALGITAGKMQLLKTFGRFRPAEIYETAPE